MHICIVIMNISAYFFMWWSDREVRIFGSCTSTSVVS